MSLRGLETNEPLKRYLEIKAEIERLDGTAVVVKEQAFSFEKPLKREAA